MRWAGSHYLGQSNRDLKAPGREKACSFTNSLRARLQIGYARSGKVGRTCAVLQHFNF